MAVWDRLMTFWRGDEEEDSTAPLVVPQIPPRDLPDYAAHYSIKSLTLKQLDEVYNLDLRCFAHGEVYTLETFGRLLTDERCLAYRIVNAEDEMAGFIITLLEDDGTAHITTVGVAPEHRRRGLAYRLLRRVEEAYRRRGIHFLRLEVRAGNFSARHLYARAGFFATQKLRRYYSNGGDGVLMVKSI